MAVDFERNEGSIVIQTSERVDSSNALQFQEDLSGVIEPSDAKVVLDMGRLSYISSAGLRVILQVAKTLQRQNAGFAVCGLSGTVREVFEISGFDQVIAIHSSPAEALAALNG